MELYTFIQVGKSPDDIDLIKITPTDDKALRLELGRSFSNFDAARANCYDPKDKQKLLSVIERGFGTLGGFNFQARAHLS